MRYFDDEDLPNSRCHSPSRSEDDGYRTPQPPTNRTAQPARRRTLSIVDLIQAGTLNVEMAAYAMRARHEGASLLTAARPGGAGKTTLMAALLSFLPPGVPIVTVDSSRVIREGLAAWLPNPRATWPTKLAPGAGSPGGWPPAAS